MQSITVFKINETNKVTPTLNPNSIATHTPMLTLTLTISLSHPRHNPNPHPNKAEAQKIINHWRNKLHLEQMQWQMSKSKVTLK